MSTRGLYLIPERRARADQLNYSVHLAAQLAGVMAHVNCHDMRRGFFRDVAHLPKTTFAGATSIGVAQAGGHTYKAMSSGLTGQYTGGISEDLHAARVSAPKRANDARAVPVDPERASKKRKNNSPQEVDQQCEAMGLDKNIRNNRQRASRALVASNREAWKQDEMTTDDVLQGPDGELQALDALSF